MLSLFSFSQFCQHIKMPLPFAIIVKSLLLWVPFLLLLPLVFVILFFLSICKISVLILRKLLKRYDLIRPVSGLDVSFSTDNFFGRPLGSLAFIWNVDGCISPQLIIDRLENVLKCAETSEIATEKESSSTNGFEKLTSVYPIFWLGYPFWKKVDTSFHVKNHVKVSELSKEFTHPDDINKQICEWMQEPFTHGLPLWELRIIPNATFSHLSCIVENRNSVSQTARQPDNNGGETCEDTSPKNFKVPSILILKTHHIIGDGKSMLKLLDKIVDSPERFAIPSKMGNKAETTTPATKSYWEDKKKGKVPVSPVLDMNKETRDRGTDTVLARKISNAFGLIKIWKKVTGATLTTILAAMMGRNNNFGLFAKVNQKSLSLCRQVPNILLLTFLSPAAVFSLVKEFAIHRDAWFTQKKLSFQANLATTGISLNALNEIRKDLCHKTCSLLNPGGKNDKWNPKELQPLPVPIIVIAVSVLTGALRRFLSEPSEQKPEHGPGDNLKTSNVRNSASEEVHRDMHELRSYTADTTCTTADSQSFVNFVVALPLQKEHPGSTTFCNFW